MLSPACSTFCTLLAARMNFGLRVVQAWAMAETGGGFRVVEATPNNFLNIGNTDSNPSGGSSWSSPEAAAEGTYQWLVRNPASGRPILAASGKSEGEQIEAIIASPFASSHYGPPGQPGLWLRTDYNLLSPTSLQPPEPKVMPDINPPAQIVSLCTFTHPTIGACAAAVAPDGAVYCSPANAYLGGANGKQFFEGRRAARIITGAPSGYTVIDEAGETYTFPTNAP